MSLYKSLFFDFVIKEKSRVRMDESKLTKPLPFNEGDR